MPQAWLSRISAGLLTFTLLLASLSNARSDDAADVYALNQKGAQLYAQGQNSEALSTLQRALEIAERALGADDMLTAASLANVATVYRAQHRYDEAAPLFQRALTIADSMGTQDTPETLLIVYQLAMTYHAQRRFDDAIPLYKRAIATRGRAIGNEDADTLTIVNDLATLYQEHAHYTEAEALFIRILTARERAFGREHRDTITSVNNLAELYAAQGRYSEAEMLHRQALTAAEHVLGKDHKDTYRSLHNLAAVLDAQGRYVDAEAYYLRALEGHERLLGREHLNTLFTVNNLAGNYYNQGRYDEAEPLFKRVIETEERVFGIEHPSTLKTANNLAELYRVQGRYSEAEPLARRVAASAERVFGDEHDVTLTVLQNLALLLYVQGEHSEAEALYRRALAGLERTLGPDHPNVLLCLNNLAEVYRAQSRYSEAEPLYRRATETAERTLGKDHLTALVSLNNMALTYRQENRLSDAESLYQRVLEGTERAQGKEHPFVVATLHNLASLYFSRADWPKAAEYWRRSSSLAAQRVRRGASSTDTDTDRNGMRTMAADQLVSQVSGLVKAVSRIASAGHQPDSRFARETFTAAQWAGGTAAARSLTEMAARGARGNPALALLVRERQDLAVEWRKRDLMRNTVLSQPPDKRDAKGDATNLAQLAAVDARIAEIDKRLATEFPDYAALASPAPVPVEEVQAQLGADEALVLFLDTPEAKPTSEETFIWVVTKTDIRWVHSDLGTAALTSEVQALRCGLDADAWNGPQCAQLTTQTYTDDDRNAGKALPFDHARAHKLYKALFGQVEDIIKGKHLLIVPSGPLTQLPFQVLVTAPPPANGDNKTAAWFIREHALTVLPAVSSLKALRRVVGPSTATKPMIGFGNPLLDGQQNHRDPRYAAYFKKRAQLARDNQQCRTTAFQRAADLFGWHRGITPVETRGGLANIEHIRVQTPLPETAIELCAVARDLKVDVADIHLGKGANEHDVKALSTSGQLAQYRIVHFATHGSLAGELKGTSEPGLILTPPGTATEDDDGYLSASEIAGLKLDADWVILSACNTAAGDATGVQALSGLARAFIYAQARALLVSHWAVDSDATVKLITGAMREMSFDSKTGRAEALRRSMLALIDKSEAREAHPAFWAPFIVVGEGAQ